MAFLVSAGRVVAAATLALAIVPLSAAEPPAAAGKPSVAEPISADALIRQALRSLSQGEGDYATLLARALAADPRSEPAHWHNGFVQESGRWTQYRALVDDDAHRRRLDQYETERTKRKGTVEDQWAMARWCRDHDLPNQERAHLFKVVSIDPDHEFARARLGFVRVGGQWIERSEIEETRLRKIATEQEFKKWATVLKPIRLAFESGDAARIAAAREKLLTIRDPAAIPAMETMVSRASLDAASAVVMVIRQMPGPDAAVGLARQAVFAEWYPAGKQAAEALREYDELRYVPLLMSGLSTPPIDTYGMKYRSDWERGQLFVRYEFQRERQDRIENVSYDISYGVWTFSSSPASAVPLAAKARSQNFLAASNLNSVRPIPGYTLITGVNSLMYYNQVLAQRAETDAARLQDLVEQETRVTKALNERICRALRTAAAASEPSNKDLSDDPKVWWNWWNQRQEVVAAAQKTVTNTRFVAESPQFVPTYNEPYFLPIGMSCLVAGTKVWTDAGPRPVETIRLGDRVLSQNVETGELAYRAVLQPTVRPPASMVVLRFGKHEICATGGHPFWALGRGWMKARDFEPGMRMHSVNGPIEVTSIEPAPDAKAYNLVVDEFHTYFVGDDMVFSHDNLSPKPSRGGVPGESIR